MISWNASTFYNRKLQTFYNRKFKVYPTVRHTGTIKLHILPSLSFYNDQLVASLISSTPLYTYCLYYFEASLWIVCTWMEQLIEEVTVPLYTALILFFPAGRSGDPWNSLASYVYLSFGTNQSLFVWNYRSFGTSYLSYWTLRSSRAGLRTNSSSSINAYPVQ